MEGRTGGSGRKDGRGRMVALLYSFATSLGRGTYKERNEIKTKRNEINENETKRNETKSTKWKRNETKPTKAKRNRLV
jgi:hypothetical protein